MGPPGVSGGGRGLALGGRRQPEQGVPAAPFYAQAGPAGAGGVEHLGRRGIAQRLQQPAPRHQRVRLQDAVPRGRRLEGALTRQDMLSREHQGPRAVLNALERLAGGYGVEGDGVRQDLGIAQAQLQEAEGLRQ